METMRAERCEGGLWATYARNIATSADTKDTGAIAVAGGFAICLQGTFLEYAIGIGARGPLDETDFSAVEAFYGRRGLPARMELHEEVAARDDRHDWAEVVGKASDDPDRERVARSMQVNAHAAMLFSASADGQLIGGGAVSTFEDGAVLFAGGVLPAFRARGVHGALIRSRLAYARSRGSSFAVMKTTPDSTASHNALECGFTRTHARLRFRKG